MIQQRLNALRQKMKEAGISIYVVPSTDCHESEYVSEHYRARTYMTGFTGSAGTAVITLEEAGLWTDGRYFIQAGQQLQGTGITLYRMGEPGVPTVEAFVEEKLSEGMVLGFDGRVMGSFVAEKLKRAADAKKAKIHVTDDLVGAIWEDRPAIPDAEVFLLEERWSGESAAHKLSRVREEMKKQGADVHVLASLCDIAWLLNIRGGDIPCVPVVFSYLYLTEESCRFYVRPSVVTEELTAYLQQMGVEICDYESIYSDLEQLESGSCVLLDKRSVNYRLLSSIPADVKILNRNNPTELMKAIKNETELANLRSAHLKEGIAFTRFMYWLKTNVGRIEITELSAADKLRELREEQENCLGLSFNTICSYGANGAIVHYSATEETNTVVQPEGFLLVDAGGQYLDGTTDTTRTFVLGPVSEEMKQMFTAVCRGNLNLANARFLYGCTGQQLDVLCREPLWQLHTDFKHGTGHGVGYLLNVHEGPNSFRFKMAEGNTPAVLEAGMVTTDEPGVYIEGKYGIRLENELVCVKSEQNEYGQFMEFENLTLTPLDLDAILPDEMTPAERKYLNAFHKKVYEALVDHLPEEEQIWLAQATRAI
jgi:Xaa-Pro aminopeptidase